MMATESGKQTPRPWAPPALESPEEKSKREAREQQARFFVECIKQAMRELAEEEGNGKKPKEKSFLEELGIGL